MPDHNGFFALFLVFEFVEALYINTIVVLNFEIFLKLLYSLNSNHKKRIVAYKIFCTSFSLIYVLFFIIARMGDDEEFEEFTYRIFRPGYSGFFSVIN